MKIWIKFAAPIIILSCALAATAVLKQGSSPEKKNLVPAATLSQEAILGKLEKVSGKMRGKNGQFYFSGRMVMIDAIEGQSNVPFIFCSDGSSYYYCIGQTIFLNIDGAFVQVDRKAKKVFVSQVSEGYRPDLMDVSNIRKAIESKEYAFSAWEQGSRETIKLLNEDHLNCKEYTITYDTVGYNITRFYSRFADQDALPGDKNDKIIDITISEWKEVKAIQPFLSGIKKSYKEGNLSVIDKDIAHFQVINL